MSQMKLRRIFAKRAIVLVDVETRQIHLIKNIGALTLKFIFSDVSN